MTDYKLDSIQLNYTERDFFNVPQLIQAKCHRPTLRDVERTVERVVKSESSCEYCAHFMYDGGAYDTIYMEHPNIGTRTLTVVHHDGWNSEDLPATCTTREFKAKMREVMGL